MKTVKKKYKPAITEKKPEQLNMPLERFDCHYKDCAAPLCPKDVSFGKRVWFPYEPVCRLKDAPEWVKKQRQIARLKGIDDGKYFTFRMLKKIDEVRRDMQGADPDYVTAERIWFNWYLGKSRKKKSPAPNTKSKPVQHQIEGFTED